MSYTSYHENLEKENEMSDSQLWDRTVDDLTRVRVSLERQLADVRTKNTELEQKNRELQNNHLCLRVEQLQKRNLELVAKVVELEANNRRFSGGFSNLRTANRLRAKEWGHTNEGFDAVFYAMATAGECGEACNVQKKLERARLDAKGTRATLGDLAQEMADTIIYLDLWAESIGINLWEAVVNTFNNKSIEMGFSTRI